MSHITNILLITAPDDRLSDPGAFPSVVKFNWYLEKTYGEQNTFKKLSNKSGGAYAMESDVFGVAINYCDIEELLKTFRSIWWEYLGSVQLLVRDQEWDTFKVFEFGGCDAERNN